jgi:FG-GAP-like repeat
MTIRSACGFAYSAITILGLLISSSPAQTAPTFTRNDIAVGNFPVSLAIADFNGDGKPDIAVLANTTANAILSIYLGDGIGQFTFKTNFSTGYGSVWIDAADLNGDRFADLVVANGLGRSVSVFLALGDGTFGPRADIPLPGEIESVLLADLNRDGKTDIAASTMSLLVWKIEEDYCRIADRLFSGDRLKCFVERCERKSQETLKELQASERKLYEIAAAQFDLQLLKEALTNPHFIATNRPHQDRQ